jgi:hypothetical protein
LCYFLEANVKFLSETNHSLSARARLSLSFWIMHSKFQNQCSTIGDKNQQSHHKNDCKTSNCFVFSICRIIWRKHSVWLPEIVQVPVARLFTIHCDLTRKNMLS